MAMSSFTLASCESTSGNDERCCNLHNAMLLTGVCG